MDSSNDSGPPPVGLARSPRPLSSEVMEFDLGREARRLRQETPWALHGRNAVTLVKHPDLRIVFMVMKPGARMDEHHAGARVSVHVLAGHVRLHLGDRLLDLRSGQLLALEREVTHDLAAVEESSVLLTIAWPGERTPDLK